jgi:hypothetical protein
MEAGIIPFNAVRARTFATLEIAILISRSEFEIRQPCLSNLSQNEVRSIRLYCLDLTDISGTPFLEAVGVRTVAHHAPLRARIGFARF